MISSKPTSMDYPSCSCSDSNCNPVPCPPQIQEFVGICLSTAAHEKVGKGCFDGTDCCAIYVKDIIFGL